VEKVEVVCLNKGSYDLPKNVSIFSLGKEQSALGMSKIQYALRFCRYIIQNKNKYDLVFVHMNQEYVLLGGLLWKLWGKKIFFWRNHPQGSGLTKIAVALSDKVFCTSEKSFTARFLKTEIMPAGVDTKLFIRNPDISREKNSLLMFGRIAPIKKIEVAIDALASCASKDVHPSLSVVGDTLPKNEGYLEKLKDRAEMAGVGSSVHFEKGVRFEDAPAVYGRREIFLNFTPTGSFDKTVIEALACGTKVLVSNQSMKKFLPDDSLTTGEVDDVSKKIEKLLHLDDVGSAEYAEKARETVKSQSLDALMEKLFLVFSA